VKTPTTLLCLVLSAALAGCGGGSTDSGPSKAEFIKQADAQCRVNNARALRENQAATAAVKGAADDNEVFTKLKPILQKGLAEQQADLRAFEKLTPPKADAAKVKKMIAYTEAANAQLSAIAAAVDQRNTKVLLAAQKKQAAIQAKAKAYLRAYGFKECGSGKNEVS
jgi:hypothetical protein